ncbi:hypothetical protein, partial [Jatrophihabitans sp.]|uniref:hypothetical protein n=1 Tax=Jatrophihabitans sp. TaxID=1932789 RepID=UPI002F2068FB
VLEMLGKRDSPGAGAPLRQRNLQRRSQRLLASSNTLIWAFAQDVINEFLLAHQLDLDLITLNEASPRRVIVTVTKETAQPTLDLLSGRLSTAFPSAEIRLNLPTEQQ